MFNFSGRYRYERTTNDENDNAGIWVCTLNFSSDNVDYVPFTKEIEYVVAPTVTNDLVNFLKGKYSSLTIKGASLADIVAKVAEIKTRLRNQLNAGVGLIGYDAKPNDFNEVNSTGKNTDWQ